MFETEYLLTNEEDERKKYEIKKIGSSQINININKGTKIFA